MAVNLDLVRDRFNDISRCLERLDQIGRMPRASFLADQDARDIAGYRLLVAIESAIQLCSHVSAHYADREPETDAECFAIMSEADLVPSDLSRRLQQLAWLRDQLVHIYWDVDYGRVYDGLQENMDDLRAFVRAIGAIL